MLLGDGAKSTADYLPDYLPENESSGNPSTS
jgi:hypothetical protein